MVKSCQAASREKLLRVVDANFNRAKEALRVCEDVARFILDDAVLSGRFKRARHDLNVALGSFAPKTLLRYRDIVGDVGRVTIASESRRSSVADVFRANAQRAKESLRVLEEFAKLLDIRTAVSIKKLRYLVYDLEKASSGRLQAVSDS